MGAWRPKARQAGRRALQPGTPAAGSRVAADSMTSRVSPVCSLWADDSLDAVLLSTIKELHLGLCQASSNVTPKPSDV